MKTVQILAGVVAGAVGAAVWAAIAYYAQLEIGYIAWGIGILVGVAVAATGENSTLAGVFAAVVTILSLVVGKYAAVELAVQNLHNEFVASMAVDVADVTETELQGLLAGKVAEQREQAGEEIAWPEVAEDNEDVEAQYPADIWQEAGQELSQTSEEEKSALRDEYVANSDQFTELAGNAMVNAFRQGGFIASFGLLDIIFFGLGIVTAWRIASREEGAEG